MSIADRYRREAQALSWLSSLIMAGMVDEKMKASDDRALVLAALNEAAYVLSDQASVYRRLEDKYGEGE